MSLAGASTSSAGSRASSSAIVSPRRRRDRQARGVRVERVDIAPRRRRRATDASVFKIASGPSPGSNDA